MVGSLSGMKIAILVTDGFAQSELTEPKEVWNKPARSALIISTPGGKQLRGWKHTEWGDSFPLDVALDEAQPDDYSALPLPGGVMNPDQRACLEAYARRVLPRLRQ